MQKRMLGTTGERVSVLGLGGFHLLEVSDTDASALINTFLDEGGTYIETAAQYGEGESERKVGLVLKTRRDECFLATKSHLRERQGAARSIDESLRHLNTDRIDLLIFHHVQSDEELERILGPDGAMEAFIRAREEGKIRFIGISGHGVPDTLIKALQRFDFDAVMTGVNFYDRFNFPDVEAKLIPLAKGRGIGIVGMKVFADGLLWEYPEDALRYALSLPVDTLPVGFNTMDMLKTDLRVVSSFTPMTEDEKARISKDNLLFGNYVCRLCNKCLPCPEGIDIPLIFKYEGWYDRQLRDRTVRTPPDFALRDRLRFWFENMGKAREAYEALEIKADRCTKCGKCTPLCPYGIDIIDKLEYVHFKLTEERIESISIAG